jgi:hypothetical protein
MVIYSYFPSLFLYDEEAHDLKAHSHATTSEPCAHGVTHRWSAHWLFFEDSVDAASVAGLWQAAALCRNLKVVAREHLSLACTSGLV